MAVSQSVLLTQPLSGVTFALKASRYLGLVGFSPGGWCEGVKLLQEISLAIHRDTFSTLSDAGLVPWFGGIWYHGSFSLIEATAGSEHSGKEMSQFVRKESDLVAGSPVWALQKSSLLLLFRTAPWCCVSTPGTTSLPEGWGQRWAFRIALCSLDPQITRFLADQVFFTFVLGVAIWHQRQFKGELCECLRALHEMGDVMFISGIKTSQLCPFTNTSIFRNFLKEAEIQIAVSF